MKHTGRKRLAHVLALLLAIILVWQQPESISAMAEPTDSGMLRSGGEVAFIPDSLYPDDEPYRVSNWPLHPVVNKSLIPTLDLLKDSGEGWTSEQKNFVFDSGTVFFRKVSFSRSGGIYQTAYSLPGDEVMLSWFDTKGNLIRQPLKNGTLPLNSLLYLQSERYSMIVGQAFVYADMGRGTIRDVTESRLPISVSKNSNGTWTIISQYGRTAGAWGVVWGVGSKKPLLDPGTPLNRAVWPAYDVLRKCRIGYDGYYVFSPSTYSPHASGAFWRVPSMHLANSLIRTGGSLASDLLGNALLTNALDHINDSGFIPSLPQSVWLKGLYNLGEGFFDTRYNADAARTYLIAWRKTGNPAYIDAATRMADWFLKFGTTHHFTSGTGTAEGWLVQDYGATVGARATHCALNHQLAAICLFLDLASDCGDWARAEKYRSFAGKMLDGIRFSRDRWIMRSGNLEYAWMPDGAMGLEDYPYLTYNDLCETQDLLRRVTGRIDPDLEVLRMSKRKWMDANGVTGFRRW